MHSLCPGTEGINSFTGEAGWRDGKKWLKKENEKETNRKNLMI